MKTLKYICVCAVLLFVLNSCSNKSASVSEPGNSSSVGNGLSFVNGKIVDSNNNAVSEAEVTLYDRKSDQMISSSFTDSKGEYQLSARNPGEYYIVGRKDNKNILYVNNVAIREISNTTLPPGVAWEYGSICGIVLLSNPEACSDSNINISIKQLSIMQTIRHGQKFVLTDVPEGTYQVFLYSSSKFYAGKIISVSANRNTVTDIDTVFLSFIFDVISINLSGEFLNSVDEPLILEMNDNVAEVCNAVLKEDGSSESINTTVSISGKVIIIAHDSLKYITKHNLSLKVKNKNGDVAEKEFWFYTPDSFYPVSMNISNNDGSFIQDFPVDSTIRITMSEEVSKIEGFLKYINGDSVPTIINIHGKEISITGKEHLQYNTMCYLYYTITSLKTNHALDFYTKFKTCTAR